MKIGDEVRTKKEIGSKIGGKVGTIVCADPRTPSKWIVRLRGRYYPPDHPGRELSGHSMAPDELEPID